MTPVATHNKRNLFIDLYKLALSLFVVFIHCGPYKNTEMMYYMIRLAVPGFLVISGYFFYKEGVNSDEDKAKRALKFFLSSLKYLIIGVVFAGALEIMMGLILHQDVAAIFTQWFQGNWFSDFFFNNYPVTKLYGFQLWYLIAVFLAWLIIFILYKAKLAKVVYFLPLLFFVQLFFSIWLKFIPGQTNVVTYFLTRNAYFMALPGLALGYDIACLQHKYKTPWWVPLIVGILGCGFFVTQYYEIKAYEMVSEISVSGILAAACFAYALDRLPRVDGYWAEIIYGKNAPYFIFIFHVFVYKVYNYYTHVTWEQHLGIITFVISLITYLVLHWLWLGYKFCYFEIKAKIDEKKALKEKAGQ